MSAPTDKLASLKAKQIKAVGTLGIKPFPFIEVEDFLPSWARVNMLSIDGDAVDTKSKGKKKLDFASWLAGFHNLASPSRGHVL